FLRMKRQRHPRTEVPCYVEPSEGSRRERGQRLPFLPFTQALECTVPELANSLSRHAENVADLLERVLAAAIQPEVEPQHLGIARLQRLECAPDSLREQVLLHFLLGEDRLFGDEPVHQLRILRVTDRCVQPDLGSIQRLQALHDLWREAGCLRQLLRRGITPQLLLQPLSFTEDLREIRSSVERHTYGASLVGQRRENGLANPPDRVGNELDPLLGVELSRSSDQPDVPLLDQIRKAHAAFLILLRDRDHEPEVRPYQRLYSILIAAERAVAQLDLLSGRQQIMRAD